jgi:hypothetical protein
LWAATSPTGTPQRAARGLLEHGARRRAAAGASARRNGARCATRPCPGLSKRTWSARAADSPKYNADSMPGGWVDDPLAFVAIRSDGTVTISRTVTQYRIRIF